MKIKCSLSKECKAGLTFGKPIMIIYPVNNIKEKSYMIVPVGEGACDKIQYPFMMTNCRPGTEGIFLNLIQRHL